MTEADLMTVITVGTPIVSLGAGLVVLTWWLSGQFSGMRDALISKLDEHEEKDVQRFSEVHDRIWDIQLRNARHDGEVPPAAPLPRPAH